MKAITLEKPGAPYVYQAEGTPNPPKPGPHEVLCRNIAIGLNPVDEKQRKYGFFISAFPAVLGCEATGEVIEVGEAVTKFKKGDRLCACLRLGDNGYTAFAEEFLVQDDLALKVPSSWTSADAATISVGSLTALLGIDQGLKISLSDIEKGNAANSEEWIIVLGGAGSVGNHAVQLLKFAGYKVLSTCSAKNTERVKSYGADATVDYSLPEADQKAEMSKITGNKFRRILDVVGSYTEFSYSLLGSVSTFDGQKYYSTVDNVGDIKAPENVVGSNILLGLVGKPGQPLNAHVAKYVVLLEKLLDERNFKPNEVLEVKGDLEKVLEGLEILESKRHGGKKVVINLEA